MRPDALQKTAPQSFVLRCKRWADLVKRRQWSLIALVILIASVSRGILLFGTPLMPGTNGVYYLVQARALLLHGSLGLPDLPLTFCMQASLARFVQWLSGWDLDSCILLAVKLTDAVLPALAALPVALLVRRWGKGENASHWIAPAAAAVVTLNTPMLDMVGSLGKNSLGLLWLAALLYFIHLWISCPTWRNAAGVLGFWALIAVTHIGVFGASLIFGGLALVFFLAMERGRALRALWPLLIAVVAVGLLAAGMVLWKFDAHRIQRLAEALIHPADFLTGNNMGAHGGPGSQGAMAGFPGNHAAFLQWLPSLVFGFASIAALVTCWRFRGALSVADICVVGACSVGVLVLTGPWVQGDKTPRFSLIAITPAAIAGAFALMHCKRHWLRAGLSLLISVCVIGPSFEILHRGGMPIVNEEGLRELRSLAPLLVNPDKTLIAARHGMEWWTAWTLHTHIAQIPALRTSDWQAFDAVFLLRSKKDDRSTLGGGFAKPPGPPLGGSRRDTNPMAEPEIPSDAEIIHDGNTFILARIASAPRFVVEQSGESQIEPEDRRVRKTLAESTDKMP